MRSGSITRGLALAFILAFTVTCGDGRVSPQGGTITSVQLGTGGTGGASTGPVTLNVVALTGGGLVTSANDLSVQPCDAGGGEILEWDGDSWECIATPAAGAGDITEVIAGDGLTDGGNTGAVTLNVGAGLGITVSANDVAIDPTETQRRVTTDCPPGQYINEIAEDGTATCQAYTGGSGLTLSTSDFAVNTGTGITITSDTVTLNMTAQDCSAGQYLDNVTAGGVFGCVAEVGDISNVGVSGNGLTGGGASGSVTLTFNLATAETPLTVGSTGALSDLALNTNTTVLNFTGAGATTLNSATGGAAGRLVKLNNDTGADLTITNNGGGTAANQIVTPTGASVVIPDNGVGFLLYSGTDSRWHLMADTTGGGGGAGDIEAVIAGDGLTGGGTSGSVTLDAQVGDGLELIADTISLTNDCSDGQVLKSASSGAQWNCADDDDSGVVPVVQTIAASGTQNDLAINATTTAVHFSSGSTITVTGVARSGGNIDGDCVKLYKPSGIMSIVDESGSSTAANRFMTSGDSTWNHPAASLTEICYSGTSSRWYLNDNSRLATLTVDGASTLTGLVTATAGGTTPANWTTTGTGDLVSADDLTVADDATITDALTVNGNIVFHDAGGDTLTINGTTTANELTTTGTLNVHGASNAFGNADTDTLSFVGQLRDNGTLPSISAGCGTGATRTGGRYGITVNTGTSPTTCTLTWTNAWGSTPQCHVRMRGALPGSDENGYVSAANTTSVTLDATGGLSGGELYDIICVGH